MHNKTQALLAALAVFLTGCGGGGQPTGNSVDAPTEASAAPISIGETGKAEGSDFTVTDVSTSSQIGPSGMGTTTEAGETFVVASYTIKNIGEKQLPLMERPKISLVDGNGQAYAPDELASAMSAVTLDDPVGMSADLNPNVSAKSKAAWKVDKAAFDRGTWTLVVGTDPQLTFSLK